MGPIEEKYVPRLQPVVKWIGVNPSVTWDDLDTVISPWLNGDAFADRTPLGYYPLPAIDFLSSYEPKSRTQYWSEAAGHFERWTHGESVAIGLAFAFRLADRLDRIGPLAVAEVEDAIRGAGLPIRVPAAAARRAAVLMGTDKKRTAAGLRWVLPRRAGPSWTVEWDVEAPARAVADTVEEIAGGSGSTRKPVRG